MTETFAALLFAHVLADFVLQPNRMAAGKHRPAVMLAHVAIVLATAALATGTAHPALLALAAAHLAIDTTKIAATRAGWVKPGLAPFLADQAAHLLSLAALTLYLPDLWATGFWPSLAPQTSTAPSLMALAAGFILATRAGGFTVGLLMDPWAEATPQGLPGGGRAIGNLERGLIFLLILSGLPESIGFLIAAKSVLRFGAVGDDRKVSEYVIIGTLASFGWAIATAFLTVTLLGLLPPLGIPDLTP